MLDDHTEDTRGTASGGEPPVKRWTGRVWFNLGVEIDKDQECNSAEDAEESAMSMVEFALRHHGINFELDGEYAQEDGGHG